MDKYIKCEDAKAAFCRYMGFTSKRAAIAVEAIVDKIPAADVVERPRWISVKERLPEIKEHHASDTVFVYLDNGDMAFCELVENIFGQVCFEIERPSPDGSSDYTVTHWMPIPEPPKEVKQS